MNIAEWILVAILSLTLFIFLVTGICFLAKLIKLTGKIGEAVEKGEAIADNVNGIAENVRGMTSIGGAIELFVNKYITPHLKDKTKKDSK